MTPPARYRTDYHLWLGVAACVFVALGFFDPSGGMSKGSSSLWATVAVLVTHYDRINTSEMLAAVACYSALLAGAAALVGWAVQAVMVVARSRRTVNG